MEDILNGKAASNPTLATTVALRRRILNYSAMYEVYRFGMSKYTHRFLAEGFDTWDVIRDITEADLVFLGVCITGWM